MRNLYGMTWDFEEGNELEHSQSLVSDDPSMTSTKGIINKLATVPILYHSKGTKSTIYINQSFEMELQIERNLEPELRSRHFPQNFVRPNIIRFMRSLCDWLWVSSRVKNERAESLEQTTALLSGLKAAA